MDRYCISELRMYYGALLSERQNEMLRLHYDEDISYGELSQMFDISRQAAFDAVKKGAAFLENFENKLGLFERDGKILELLSDSLALLNGAESDKTEPHCIDSAEKSTLCTKNMVEIKNLLEE